MKYLLTIVASIVTLCASAQTAPVGIVMNGATPTISEAPASTIFIDITLTKSTFTAGIYARYAQKYLGERAPLINRESITISSSAVALAPKDYFVAAEEVTPQVTTTKSPASKLPANITSAEITIPEIAAERAANKIFDIRKLSHDLVAGNIGEGVFGAGLATALDRLDREEAECLALFMGSEQVTTSTKRYTVNIDPNTKRYIIGRLDPSRGLISTGEIDGDPIYMQITPEIVADTTYALSSSKSARQAVFVSPNRAQCDLYVGANVVTSSVLPLYEFGKRTTVLYETK